MKSSNRNYNSLLQTFRPLMGVVLVVTMTFSSVCMADKVGTVRGVLATTTSSHRQLKGSTTDKMDDTTAPVTSTTTTSFKGTGSKLGQAPSSSPSITPTISSGRGNNNNNNNNQDNNNNSDEEDIVIVAPPISSVDNTDFPSTSPSVFDPDVSSEHEESGMDDSSSPSTRSCPSAESDFYWNLVGRTGERELIPCLSNADCVDYEPTHSDRACCQWPTCLCGPYVPEDSPYYTKCVNYEF